MLADLTVSLLAGLAIFPAVFSLGFNPAGGPALLFNTIPAVFAQMPMGHALMVLFFTLTAFAATGALLSLIEVPVAVLHERLGWSRVRATWAAIVCMAVLGSLCALSFSTLGGVTLIGKNNIFDSFDFASSKILMPLAGLLTSLFVSRHWGNLGQRMPAGGCVLGVVDGFSHSDRRDHVFWPDDMKPLLSKPRVCVSGHVWHRLA